MKLALFDLDHTLLDGDTNILWIDYLIAHGLCSPETANRQQHFMDLYAREQLDMAAYMDFHLSLLGQRSLSAWQPIVEDFVRTQLLPRLAPDALAALHAHQAAHDRVAVVTATNSVIVQVLGRVLGVHTIATEVEVVDDHTTGHMQGLPSFREHKITRVQDWIGVPLDSPQVQQSVFYSDSANDLPLLQTVSHPVVVNADARLRAWADEHEWPQRSWRVAQACA